MGFKKGDYVRCVICDSGLGLLTEHAVYRVESVPNDTNNIRIEPSTLPVESWLSSRFIPWEPAPGDWLKQNTTGGEFCLKAHSANSMEDWSVEKNPAHPFIHGVYIHTHFTPILARAPKQIEEKTELAIGDEVEALPTSHKPWCENPKAYDAFNLGRWKISSIIEDFWGTRCAGGFVEKRPTGWWPIDSLRKINGGSGAVAPATGAVPAQREPHFAETLTPVSTDIDAFWTDGDVRQWARDERKYCLAVVDSRTMESLRDELRIWLRTKNKPPRIPTYRQITMNEKAFLEPRILG